MRLVELVVQVEATVWLPASQGRLCCMELLKDV